MLKKIFIVATLFILGIIFIYREELKNEFIKDDVYILFDLDQIKNYDKKFPRKFVFESNGKEQFGIQISKSQKYVFQHDAFESVGHEKIENLKIIPFDSVTKILLNDTFNPALDWHIVKIEDKNNNAFIAKARPTIINY